MCQSLTCTWFWQWVEIATQYEWYAVGVRGSGPWPQWCLRLLYDVLQFVHQHHGLDELHIAELRVPVDMAGGHQDGLSLLALRGNTWQTHTHTHTHTNIYTYFMLNIKATIPVCWGLQHVLTVSFPKLKFQLLLIGYRSPHSGIFSQ